MGPQGTKAWLRTDLGPAALPDRPGPLLTAPPPGPPLGPPYGNPPPSYPPTGGQPVQGPPRKRKNRLVLWSILSVLLVAAVGTATWWFAAGRWTSVPTVGGQDRASAERTLTASDIHPQVLSVRDNTIESGTVIRTEPGAGARVLRGDTVKLIVSMGRPTVPDVRAGISPEDAEQAVSAAELQPLRDDGKKEFSDTVPKGMVIRLDPKSGTQLNISAPVTIIVSKGQKPKPVPDVHGRSRDEAFDLLRQAGYEPFDAPKEFAGDVDGGKVLRTDPPAGTERKDDTASNRVGVVVSNAVGVPDVTRHPVAEAKATLEALHLTVEVQQFGQADGGRVFSQTPPAGSRVPEGSKVVLFVFLGI
jgi:serine/threonine-protein kinase